LGAYRIPLETGLLIPSDKFLFSSSGLQENLSVREHRYQSWPASPMAHSSLNSRAGQTDPEGFDNTAHF